MEDKLVTLAILTYTKAQILKNVLENEGIETYIHNVNQIQPVVSSGVRLRIKESDLPRALKITESSTWLSESIVGEKTPKVDSKSNKILIPVDFSNYSMKACEFGFNLAKTENSEGFYYMFTLHRYTLRHYHMAMYSIIRSEMKNLLKQSSSRSIQISTHYLIRLRKKLHLENFRISNIVAFYEKEFRRKKS